MPTRAAAARRPQPNRTVAQSTSLQAPQPPEAAGFAQLRPHEGALLVPDTVLAAAPAALAAVPTDTSRTPPYLPARLTVGFAAGLALTHRQLAKDAADFQSLERPAVAPDAQLDVGLRLTPIWRLNAGIGYAAYRQTLRVNVTKRSGHYVAVPQTVLNDLGQPVTVSSWQYVADSVMGQTRVARSTYQRYLTVPLTLEWRPRRHRVRFQPLMAVGPVLNVRLSSRLAVPTDDCGCETIPTGIRPIALGLALNGGFDWALRPDFWLTARVTAAGFLTPAAYADQPRRYPWRTGLQIGLRYDLPRRRP